MLHFNQCFLFWSFLDDFIFIWNIRIVNFFVNCTGLPCSSLPGELSLTGVTFSVQISSCKRNDYHRLERQSLRLVFSGFVRVLPVHWTWTVSLVCFFFFHFTVLVHAWLLGIVCIRGNYIWSCRPTILRIDRQGWYTVKDHVTCWCCS